MESINYLTTSFDEELVANVSRIIVRSQVLTHKLHLADGSEDLGAISAELEQATAELRDSVCLLSPEQLDDAWEQSCARLQEHDLTV
jgi:hypothetical protein